MLSARTVLRQTPNLIQTVFVRNAYLFKRTRYPYKKLRIKDKELATQENINLKAVKGQEFEELVVQHPHEDQMTYEVLETEQAPQPVKVILLRNTDDFGKRGQIVTVDDPIEAKSELILPGAAVYATPENLEKYKDIAIPEENFRFSSPYVKSILPRLTREVIPVTMNMHTEWEIEPFHIKVALDRRNFEAPLEAIEFPHDRKIKGPNLDLEDKEFYVYLTINKFEKIPLRCIVHHRADDPSESAHLKTIGWMHRFNEPVFEEDRAFLDSMKRPRFFGPKAAEVKDIGPHIEKYKEWKRTRDEMLQKM